MQTSFSSAFRGALSVTVAIGLLILPARIDVAAVPSSDQMAPLLLKVLTGSDSVDRDTFGRSVAVSGDTVVVGAPLTPNAGAYRGSAYVYQKQSGGTLVQVAELQSPQPYDRGRFGHAVAIAGDTLVVSEPASTGANAGLVFVYVKNGAGAFEPVATLSASDGVADAGFGASLAVSGETIVVGAYGVATTLTFGAAYVFNKPSGGWRTATEDARLTESTRDRTSAFGYAVDVSDDTIVVGAPAAAVGGQARGLAYAYVKGPNGWTTGTERAVLFASDRSDASFLGYSVGVSGNTIFAGAPRAPRDSGALGKVYTFTKPAAGWAPGSESSFLAPSASESVDHFGVSMDVDAQTIAIGAALSASGQILARAYLFTEPSSGWSAASEQAVLKPTDSSIKTDFGNAVALTPSTVVVGAQMDSTLGIDRGSAYVYNIAPVATVAPTSLTFGEQEVGETGTTSVTLSNTGRSLLRVTSISASGAGSGVYKIANDMCSSPIVIGGACTFDVQFSPTSTDASNASIEVASNAGLVSIPATGLGVKTGKKQQVPVTKVALPKKIKAGDRTVLVKRAIMTNAGQRASVRVRCVPLRSSRRSSGDVRLCLVQRSVKGRVWITVSGRTPTRVTVRLSAPPTAEFDAYRKSFVYRVRA